MTCKSARRQWTDLLAGEESPELREHLAACAECARERDLLLATVAQLAPPQRVQASEDFTRRTVERLSRELLAAPSRRAWFRNTPFVRAMAMAVALLAIVVVLPYFSSIGTNRSTVALLAQSVQSLDQLASVHIQAQMRTPPGDNFEVIGTDYSFQPVEMWKVFGVQPSWRVENPGRVVVVSGNGATLLQKPNQVVRGSRDAGFIECLRPLLDPAQVLGAELAAARRGESRASIAQQGPRITLTTARKARGEFFQEWGKNGTVEQSDHTRIYQFDASTHRLTGLQVIVHTGTADVVVFEITSIQYNEALDAALFAIQIPDGAIEDVPPERMPVNRPLPVTARDAAVMFLEGLARRDWEQVLMVYPMTAVPEDMQRDGGGLRVISIGEPFRSGLYAGWFVPYDIVLADGTHKQWNLAVRNDNGVQRWIQDGGF